jgi:hypothetical protein
LRSDFELQWLHDCTLPTAGFKDGFKQGLSELEKHKFSDKLGLHLRGGTYRFGPSRVEGKEEG